MYKSILSLFVVLFCCAQIHVYAADWSSSELEVFIKDNVRDSAECKVSIDVENKTFSSVKSYKQLVEVVKDAQEKGISLYMLRSLTGGLSFWKLDSRFKDIDTIKTKHDLSTNGGGTAWMLEQFLNCEFPPVSATTTSETIRNIQNDARKYLMALDEMPIVAADLTTKVDLSSRNKLEKIDLGKKEDTPLYILSELARESDVEIRRTIAANPKTPYHTIEMLCTDKDQITRETAQKAPVIVSSYTIDMPFPDMKFVRKKQAVPNKK
jgi:hypothetical protein